LDHLGVGQRLQRIADVGGVTDIVRSVDARRQRHIEISPDAVDP